MDTSSYDIHSLNEISFIFIVFHCCYFSAMKRKQFISKFWVLHGGSQYKAPQTRILQIFWIGNYRKMDWKGNDCESWRQVYKGSIHIMAMGFKEYCKFWKLTLEWCLKVFYSYTSLKHIMNTHLLQLLSFSSVMTTFEIFLSKNLERSILISNFGVSTTILNLVGGASWTLDCCKARLNHTIFLKE